MPTAVRCPVRNPGRRRIGLGCGSASSSATVLGDARRSSGILAHHNAALCWSDRRGRPLGPLWRTADWGYLRLHEGAAQPWPHYGRAGPAHLAHPISDSFPPEADVFAYFNNDQHAAAPADAEALIRLADARLAGGAPGFG